MDKCYNDRWKAEHTITYSLRFSKNTDMDLIEWLSNVPSKQGEIKRLMRIAIEAEQEKTK